MWWDKMVKRRPLFYGLSVIIFSFDKTSQSGWAVQKKTKIIYHSFFISQRTLLNCNLIQLFSYLWIHAVPDERHNPQPLNFLIYEMPSKKALKLFGINLPIRLLLLIRKNYKIFLRITNYKKKNKKWQ